MTNPYSSTAWQGSPTVKAVSWTAVGLHLLVLVTCATAGWCITLSSSGVFWGIGLFLIYSGVSRKLMLRNHRRGIDLVRRQLFEDAIDAFSSSYQFFSRHDWVDRYRSITMMSASAISYREMALINTAFAYGQIGNGNQAKAYYVRAKEEFPNSVMAQSALNMISAVTSADAAV